MAKVLGNAICKNRKIEKKPDNQKNLNRGQDMY